MGCSSCSRAIAPLSHRDGHLREAAGEKDRLIAHIAGSVARPHQEAHG